MPGESEDSPQDVRPLTISDLTLLQLQALAQPRCRPLLAALNDSSMTVSELSRAAGYPKSTAFRLLKALQEAGFVERGERQGKRVGYTLTHAGRCVVLSLKQE